MTAVKKGRRNLRKVHPVELRQKRREDACLRRPRRVETQLVVGEMKRPFEGPFKKSHKTSKKSSHYLLTE